MKTLLNIILVIILSIATTTIYLKLIHSEIITNETTECKNAKLKYKEYTESPVATIEMIEKQEHRVKISCNK